MKGICVDRYLTWYAWGLGIYGSRRSIGLLLGPATIEVSWGWSQ